MEQIGKTCPLTSSGLMKSLISTAWAIGTGGWAGIALSG